jgi:hypothetical protein
MCTTARSFFVQKYIKLVEVFSVVVTLLHKIQGLCMASLNFPPNPVCEFLLQLCDDRRMPSFFQFLTSNNHICHIPAKIYIAGNVKDRQDVHCAVHVCGGSKTLHNSNIHLANIRGGGKTGHVVCKYLVRTQKPPERSMSGQSNAPQTPHYNPTVFPSCSLVI